MNVYERLAPARRECLLRKEGWYIWGASVCRYQDKYYIFASGWEKQYKFQGWVKHSTIFKGVSDRPEGPFKVLGEMEELKQQEWSSEVLHNPTVCKVGDTYYLFYVGTRYHVDGRTCVLPDDYEVYRYNQRIGVAVSENPIEGFRPVKENPILDISESGWDSTYVTNPSVWAEDGKIYMVYKALIQDRLPDIVMKLGLAEGEKVAGPYRRILDHPLLQYNIEDPFIWKEEGYYHLLAKDMTGELAGKPDEAVVLESSDMKKFAWREKRAAYSTEIEWEDGVEYYQNVERPQIYFEEGKPVCLYNAVRTKDDGSFNVARRFR